MQKLDENDRLCFKYLLFDVNKLLNMMLYLFNCIFDYFLRLLY